MKFILNKKEVKMKKTILLYILLFNGIIYAQQQVKEKEVINAATNLLYNKAAVLKISPNTEIESVHKFYNDRTLFCGNDFKRWLGVNAKDDGTAVRIQKAISEKLYK
jgi:hypothetical protein